MEEEEEVTVTEAEEAFARFMGYIFLIILIFLLGSTAIGAIIAPLVPHG